MENWKQAPGFEGWYEVSDLGRVRRSRTGKATFIGKILKPCKRKSGHVSVSLRINGISKTAEVHRLVAAAFIGPCPKGKEVNHIDGKPFNNVPDNLEYVTRSENILHAYRLGLIKPVRGERVKGAKLTEHDIRLVRASPLGTRAIAIHYGISTANVKKIRSRTIWKHVK